MYYKSRLFSQADETPWTGCGFGGRRVAGVFLLDLPRGLRGGVSDGGFGSGKFGVGVGVDDGLGTASLSSNDGVHDGVGTTSLCLDNGARTRRTGEPRDDGLRTRGTAGSIGGKGVGGASVIRCSNLDILICCLTTVSFSSRCWACPYYEYQLLRWTTFETYLEV